MKNIVESLRDMLEGKLAIIGIAFVVVIIILSCVGAYYYTYQTDSSTQYVGVDSESVVNETGVSTDLETEVHQIIEQDLVGEWYLNSEKYSYVMASSDMVYDLLMLQRKSEPDIYDLAYYKIDKDNNIYVTVTEQLINGELTPLAETTNYTFRLVQDDTFIYSLYEEDGDSFVLEFNQENLKLIDEEVIENDK